MKLLRLIKFLLLDVGWVGLKFYLEIPLDIWREFQKKEHDSS